MNNQDYNFGNNNNTYNGQSNGLKSFDQLNNEFMMSQNGNYPYQYNGMNNFPQVPNAQNNNMYNSYVNKSNISSSPSREKLRWGKILIPIIILFFIVTCSFIGYKMFKNTDKKIRTFMIYMVGSDLESQSKQGTYSISEIVGEKIDLENNNVVLMVGGAKKWHNFVSADEIGIYNLTSEGFKKVKSLPVTSMGDSSNLTTFLDYSYNNYSLLLV